jgi:hypothetical protein
MLKVHVPDQPVHPLAYLVEKVEPGCHHQQLEVPWNPGRLCDHPTASRTAPLLVQGVGLVELLAALAEGHDR